MFQPTLGGINPPTTVPKEERNKTILIHLHEMERIIRTLRSIVTKADEALNKIDVQSHLFEIENEIVELETLVEEV